MKEKYIQLEPINNKMNEKTVRVSIMTPTYNRSDKIGRLYHSLLRQTAQGVFEWIVADDGSIDDTEKIVLGFMEEASFPIRYFKQQNMGKHVAVNRLIEMAGGVYGLIMDDDDELLPDAVERFLKLWDRYGDNEKLWCICGRCIDAVSREIVGKPIVKGINELSWEKRRSESKKAGGERCGMARMECLKLYKYPEEKGMKFIPEAYVWRRLDAVYEQYYIDEPFRIYHQFEGESLSNRSKTKERYESDFIMYQYIFGDTYLCPKRFSRLYFIELYQYRLAKVRTGKGGKEFYAPLPAVEKVLAWFTWLPCWLLRLRRNE